MPTNKKVIIAGSASLQKEILKWVLYWDNKKAHKVINYPQPIPIKDFDKLYPKVHIDFFKDLKRADIIFIANEDKKGIKGYIGSETFAELAFGLAEKLVYKRKVKLILAQMPAKEVASHEEICLWKRLGWIDEMIDSN